MKSYELTCLISTKLNEEEIKAFSQTISNFILGEGGIVKEIGNPVKKRLGYPIKKEGVAYVLTFYFHLEEEKVSDLENNLKQHTAVLRHLLVIKKGPSQRTLLRASRTKRIGGITTPQLTPTERIKLPVKQQAEKQKQEKVELKEIEKELEQILGE